MTIPSDSSRFIVDSSGWIEYFGDGPKASAFGEYIDGPGALLLPTIVIYEVMKKLLREQGKTIADRFYSQACGFDDRIIALDVQLAGFAANMSLEWHLPMADAIIYATAQAHQAKLITSDAHFSGLPGVTLL